MAITRLWVPHAAGVPALGPLPGDVIVDVWDGDGPPPAGADEVRMYVPPWVPHGPTADIMTELANLRVVQALTAGVERVRPHVPPGVTLCTARGVHDAATSEWVVTAMLASQRDFPMLIREQIAGDVPRRPSQSLDGQRVLILGYGSIGQAVERRLTGFDVEITRVASRAREGVHGPEDLTRLLSDTDILVVLVSMSEATRALVGRAELDALPDGALVVNAARGGLLDQDALTEHVGAGRLRAALDVADPDPLPADHPLRTSPRVLYTPHRAGSTVRTIPSVYAFIGRQLGRLVRGEPLENVV
jgi:phosphoglycerate dehydrogenase-like enzyme